MAVKSSRRQKKLWFSIVTPKDFGHYVIGETTAFEPQQLVGRNIKMNLMGLIHDPKKQNIRLVFQIKNVTDKTATTEIIRYELQSSYIKRMMRKGRKKIEDSFVIQTKDNVKARIKPIIITRLKTQRSVLTLIRKEAKEFIEEKVKTQNFVDLINNTISTKFQREIRDKLKKIYPLALCEFGVITKI